MLGRGFFPQYAASQWAVQGRLPMSLCLTHLQKGGPRSTFLLKHWRWTLICCSVPCWFCWWYPPWWWSGPGISIVCSGSNYSQMWDQKGTPPSSPCPDQVTRAASHPARLLQAFHLTLFFYSLGDVLAFSCFLPAATHAKKSLWGFSGLFLQVLDMGMFWGYGKVCACDQKGFLLCFVTKFLAFLKFFRQRGSKYFSNLKKIIFGDICISSPSHTWSQAQVCHSFILPAVMVPLGVAPEWPKPVVQKGPKTCQASASAHVLCGQKHGPESSHHSVPPVPVLPPSREQAQGTSPKPCTTLLQGRRRICQQLEWGDKTEFWGMLSTLDHSWQTSC